jgi:hypothetical protein
VTLTAATAAVARWASVELLGSSMTANERAALIASLPLSVATSLTAIKVMQRYGLHKARGLSTPAASTLAELPGPDAWTGNARGSLSHPSRAKPRATPQPAEAVSGLCLWASGDPPPVRAALNAAALGFTNSVFSVYGAR